MLGLEDELRSAFGAGPPGAVSDVEFKRDEVTKVAPRVRQQRKDDADERGGTKHSAIVA